MAKKLDKTLADYVVGGVMPALLIGLLVSLCYFLLELALSGQNVGQLKWVLFFFIVGTVLIARIAMRGDIADRAGVYGIALAIAAGLALVRFVEIPQTALGGFGWLVPISLMSVIWWSAHKLTLDSTFDEDGEPEEAGGLFDAVPEAEAGEKPKGKDWFGQYQAEREAEQKKKKPGMMLVYFSLAALPLFGLGQAILPAADVERRRYAFWLLTLYVACGLGMLLTTSFLGLRRYLRGRRLQMPAAMTGMWLGLGSALIVTLMILSAYFLPRPEAEYHLSQLLGWAGSKERDANRTHFFEGSTGKSGDASSGGQGKQPQNDARQRDGDRQGRQGGQRGQQSGGNSAGQKQSGDQNVRPGGSNNSKAEGRQPGQGNQGEGEQGSQGQGNNGQGQSKSQSGAGNKTGRQGRSAGGNDKTGEKQPGQGGEQDPRGQGGGKTPEKQGERGNQEQGQGEGDPQKSNDKQNPPDQGQQPNEERQGSRDGEKQQEQQQQDQGSGSSPPPPPQQPPPPQSSMSWDWLQWVVWAVIILGVLFALWKWGRQLWAALLQIWREILAWWHGLFGSKEKPSAEEELAAAEANLPPQPFAWFTNPLLTPGRFKSMEEMIRYSFAALHSWAYEQNLGRHPDETPTEFALRLGQQRQRVHQDVRKLADLYAVVTYARVTPPPGSEAVLRNFWSRLGEEPTRPVVVN